MSLLGQEQGPGPSPKLLAYVKLAASLEVILLHGLSAREFAWSAFLCRGLYDPRLFLYIWGFVH